MSKQETLFGQKLSYDNKAKLVFLALAFFSILLFAHVAMGIWEAAGEKKQRVQQMEQLIENAEKTSTNKDDVSQSYLFAGQNLAEIQSKLQQSVKQIGDKYRIAIDSIQALDPVSENNLVVSRIRLNGAIPEAQFAPFLVELSQSKPGIYVSDMDIRPVQVRATRVADVSEVEPKVSMQIVLSGLSTLNPTFALQ